MLQEEKEINLLLANWNKRNKKLIRLLKKVDRERSRGELIFKYTKECTFAENLPGTNEPNANNGADNNLIKWLSDLNVGNATINEVNFSFGREVLRRKELKHLLNFCSLLPRSTRWTTCYVILRATISTD